MAMKVRAAFLLFVLAASRASAAVIYLDDFDQFAAGDDLTGLTYPLDPPRVGFNAQFASFGSPPPVITAIDFGAGNIAAQWDLPGGSGADYLGRFDAIHVEEVIDVSFRFVALATPGGFGGFFIRFPTPTLDMQVLAGFLDDGSLAVFTDTPSPASLELLPTGYAADHVYDVRLVMNLPANTYSWFLDGTSVVSGRPIPPHINATTMHQFGFDANEEFPAAQGNSWVVDDVRAEVVAAAPEPAMLVLLASGVAGIRIRRRRNRGRSTGIR